MVSIISNTYQAINRLLFEKITPGMFRLILALLVVFYHSVAFLTIGHYAVYVFFMLSGYWIFRMYDEKYSHFRQPYKIYLISRLSRLMPVYWVILLFSLLLYFLIPDIADDLLAMKDKAFGISFLNLFVLGLASSYYQVIGTAWSLDIEIQFYLLAPVLLSLCLIRGWSIILLAVSTLLSLYMVFYQTQMVNLLVYLPYFVIGGLLYKFNIVASRPLAVTGMMLITGFLLVNYAIPVLRNGYLLNRNASLFGFNYREASNVLLALLTIPFLTINVRQKTDKHIAAKEQIRSSMSYVVYLLHWPLLQVYAQSVNGVSGMQKVAHLAAYYVTCIVLTYLVSKYIDAFFEKRRRKWLGMQELKPQIAQANA